MSLAFDRTTDVYRPTTYTAIEDLLAVTKETLAIIHEEIVDVPPDEPILPEIVQLYTFAGRLAETLNFYR